MRIQPKHSPRHFPDEHAAFAPRGWAVFRTGAELEFPTAHAVFAHPLPPPCVRRNRLTTYVQTNPDRLHAALSRAADRIDTHAQTCQPCAHARAIAARHATTE